jgi:leishmanolysin
MIPPTKPSKSHLTYISRLTLTLFLITGSIVGTENDNKLLGNSSPVAIANVLSDSESEWRPMKILVEYLKVDTTDKNLETYVKSILIAEAIKFFEKNIKVKGPKLIDKFKTTDCQDVIVPKKFHNRSTEADLIIFIDVYNKDDGTLGSAMPCLEAEPDFTPFVGILSLNLNHIKMKSAFFRSTVYTVIHEILHILAFSDSMFQNNTNMQKFIKKRKDAKAEGGEAFTIASPEIIAFGKEHFNCPTFGGIKMENEGNEASAHAHFEKIVAGNDIMIADDSGSQVLSKFVLALLKDTKWYSADLQKGEVLTWGKNAGCAFLDKKCDPKFPEFCKTEGATECSHDYLGKARCTMSAYSDECLVKDAIFEKACISASNKSSATSPLESFGKNSRCFVTVNDQNIRDASCLTSVCSDTDEITISSGEASAVCKLNQETTVLNGLKIQCPDVKRFCSMRKIMKCPDDCNGNGNCREDGTCNCDFLFTGSACEKPRNCLLEIEPVCAILRNQKQNSNEVEKPETSEINDPKPNDARRLLTMGYLTALVVLLSW